MRVKLVVAVIAGVVQASARVGVLLSVVVVAFVMVAIVVIIWLVLFGVMREVVCMLLFWV